MQNAFRICLIALVALLGAIGGAPLAYAHGFGQRYDLPVPLWLFITAAGAAVGVSFAAVGLFVRASREGYSYPRFNLLRFHPIRLLPHPYTLFVCRLVSVGLFLLILLTGFFGDENPSRNLSTVMVWVIWWVGLAYVCALTGNLWALINPWKILFTWAESLHRRFGSGGEISNKFPYPEWLGAWPAVILFLAFGWVEIVWGESDTPSQLAFAAAFYSLITWAGMLLFGKEEWLRGGEAFSVVFDLLSRFAPTEVRITNPVICASCPNRDALHREGNCVNCYDGFGRAGAKEREWNLRPPAAGLWTAEAVHPSMVMLILAVLSTVTFDGFTETSLFNNMRSGLYNYLQWTGQDALLYADTLMLLSFPLLFLGVYSLFCVFMTAVSGNVLSPGRMIRIFIFSLVPIAVAYHLAHYLSFLLVQGQFIIPLLSDPFGFGWNLLGTVGYRVQIGIVGARFVWYASVSAIVTGHIIAVYLAHITALGNLERRALALRSQYPMLILMVGYTMVGLWILSQPIVEQ